MRSNRCNPPHAERNLAVALNRRCRRHSRAQDPSFRNAPFRNRPRFSLVILSAAKNLREAMYRRIAGAVFDSVTLKLCPCGTRGYAVESRRPLTQESAERFTSAGIRDSTGQATATGGLQWAREIAPVVEEVAQRLLVRGKASGVRLPTPLTEHNRSRGRNTYRSRSRNASPAPSPKPEPKSIEELKAWLFGPARNNSKI
jgi:hypothetical protein